MWFLVCYPGDLSTLGFFINMPDDIEKTEKKKKLNPVGGQVYGIIDSFSCGAKTCMVWMTFLYFCKSERKAKTMCRVYKAKYEIPLQELTFMSVRTSSFHGIIKP